MHGQIFDCAAAGVCVFIAASQFDEQTVRFGTREMFNQKGDDPVSGAGVSLLPRKAND